MHQLTYKIETCLSQKNELSFKRGTVENLSNSFPFQH